MSTMRIDIAQNDKAIAASAVILSEAKNLRSFRFAQHDKPITSIAVILREAKNL